MLTPTSDEEQIVERIAALDIGKAEVVCCVRVPDPARPGGRLQEVTTYPTMTRSLLVMCDRLREAGATRVVMEATGEYWKSPFYLAEAAGFDTWLVNAKHVKHLPGRPKSDKIDAVWLCKVAERGMVRPSFGYDRDTPETRHKGRPIRQCDSLVADPGCDGHEFVLVSGHLRLIPVQAAYPFFHPPPAMRERGQQSPRRSLTSGNDALRPLSGVSRSHPFLVSLGAKRWPAAGSRPA